MMMALAPSWMVLPIHFDFAFVLSFEYRIQNIFRIKLRIER